MRRVGGRAKPLWYVLATVAAALGGAPCTNYPSWDVDFFGKTITCQWFADRPQRCSDSGEKMMDTNGVDALTACCRCGGGFPSTSSPTTPLPPTPLPATPGATAQPATPMPQLPTALPTLRPTNAPLPLPTALSVLTPQPASTALPRTDAPRAPSPAPATRVPPTVPPPVQATPLPSVPATAGPPHLIATGMPPTAAPVTAIPTEAPSTAAPGREEYVTATKAAEVGVVAAGMAASLGSSAGASRIVLIPERCVIGGEKPLSIPLHPTRLALLDSAALGAVVGNAALCAVLTVIAEALLRVLQWARTRDSCCFLTSCAVLNKDTTFVVRFPSTFLAVFQWLYQGTSLAGLSLLLTRPTPDQSHAWALSVGGIAAVLVCVLIPLRLLSHIRVALAEQRAEYVVDRTRGPWLVFLAGRGEWVSTTAGDLWAYSYATVLREYQQAYPWWACVEFAATLAFAFSQSFELGDVGKCAVEKFAGASVLLLMLVAHVLCLPYHRQRDNVLVGLSLGLQVASLSLVGAAYHADEYMTPETGLLEAANNMLLAAISCVITKVILDVAMETVIFASGSRAALQHQVWAATETSEAHTPYSLALSRDYAMQECGSSRGGGGTPSAFDPNPQSTPTRADTPGTTGHAHPRRVGRRRSTPLQAYQCPIRSGGGSFTVDSVRLEMSEPGSGPSDGDPPLDTVPSASPLPRRTSNRSLLNPPSSALTIKRLPSLTGTTPARVSPTPEPLRMALRAPPRERSYSLTKPNPLLRTRSLTLQSAERPSPLLARPVLPARPEPAADVDTSTLSSSGAKAGDTTAQGPPSLMKRSSSSLLNVSSRGAHGRDRSRSAVLHISPLLGDPAAPDEGGAAGTLPQQATLVPAAPSQRPRAKSTIHIRHGRTQSGGSVLEGSISFLGTSPSLHITSPMQSVTPSPLQAPIAARPQTRRARRSSFIDMGQPAVALGERRVPVLRRGSGSSQAADDAQMPEGDSVRESPLSQVSAVPLMPRRVLGDNGPGRRPSVTARSAQRIPLVRATTTSPLP